MRSAPADSPIVRPAVAAARPRASGLSPKRLARMHETMSRYVENGWLPGLVTLISRRGQEHAYAIGTLAFDRPGPMRRDTIFRLASVTKPVVAAAAMILVEECRLRLEDPVDEWLPELAHRRVLRTLESSLDDTVPAQRPIIVRDLLTFRSGYGEVGFVSPTCPYQKALVDARLPLSVWPFDGTHDEFMKRLGRLPLAHQPGERWLYHMGSEILGVLISRVSGTTLSEFLRRRLFDPLGMKDTRFTVAEEDRPRLAGCYRTDASSGKAVKYDEEGRDVAPGPRFFESGAGGLVSTADDLLAFGLMMLNRGEYGGKRFLSRASVEAMTTDQLTPEQKTASPFFENFWESRGWGLGLSIITRRTDVAESPGRFGWDGVYGVSWYVDPREDLVGILMMQRVPAVLRLPPAYLDFWTSVYQAIDD